MPPERKLTNETATFRLLAANAMVKAPASIEDRPVMRLMGTRDTEEEVVCARCGRGSHAPEVPAFRMESEAL